MSRVRYLLYARKSEEDKSRQVQSIGDQIKELRELATHRNLHIVGEIREEHSAKAPGRPQFGAMMEAIRRGEADGILVWSINRLLRNPVDHGTISWMLQQGDLASMITMDKEYLPGDNVVLLSVESAVANQFIIDLRKGTLRGLASKVEKGWFPHKAPVGYLNNVFDKTIEPDPLRFPLLQRAWKMLLSEGKSVPQILAALNGEMGFRTPSGKGGQRGAGGQPLARNTLYRLYSNIFYAGYFTRSGVIHKGLHPPMVSLDEFTQAGRILKRELRAKPQKHRFAFTGLMHCARCGGAITAEKHTKTLKATGQQHTYTYYRCCDTRRQCGKKGMSEEALVQEIDAHLARLSIPQEFKEWGMHELEHWRGEEEQGRQAAYEAKQTQLAALNRQLDTLLELRLKEVIGDDDYTRKRDELSKQCQVLHADVERMEQGGDDTRAAIENVLLFCEQARAWFASGDPEVRRLVAGALGARYELDDKRVQIEPHPVLVPILNANFALAKDTQQVRSGATNDGFEPGKTGSGSGQKGELEKVSVCWGRTWSQLRTILVAPHPHFPDLRLAMASSALPLVPVLALPGNAVTDAARPDGASHGT